MLDATHAHSMPWKEIAALMDASPTGGHPQCISCPQDQPARWSGSHSPAYSFSAQAVRVEVSLETGSVQVLQVISANDAVGV